MARVPWRPFWRLDVLEARRSSRLSQADQDRLGRLLPVLAGAFGSAEFLTREVLAHESVGLHLVVRDLSARSLGRLLRRAAGVPVGGLLVERLGQADGGALARGERSFLSFIGAETPAASGTGLGIGLHSGQESIAIAALSVHSQPGVPVLIRWSLGLAHGNAAAAAFAEQYRDSPQVPAAFSAMVERGRARMTSATTELVSYGIFDRGWPSCCLLSRGSRVLPKMKLVLPRPRYRVIGQRTAAGWVRPGESAGRRSSWIPSGTSRRASAGSRPSMKSSALRLRTRSSRR